MDLLLITKQTNFTHFTMHGIVGKVNNNVLLVQTVEIKLCGNG